MLILQITARFFFLYDVNINKFHVPPRLVAFLFVIYNTCVRMFIRVYIIEYKFRVYYLFPYRVCKWRHFYRAQRLIRRLITDATDLIFLKSLKSLINMFYYNNTHVPNFHDFSDVSTEGRINVPFHNKLTILLTKNSLSVFSRFPLTSSKV